MSELRTLFRLHPYQLLVALALAISGAVQLVTEQYALAIVSVAPGGPTVAWSLFLLLGGLAVLAGTLSDRGPLEVLGLRVLALASLVYAACTVVTAVEVPAEGFTVLSTLLTSALWGAVGLAHAIRAWVVARTWRESHNGYC